MSGPLFYLHFVDRDLPEGEQFLGACLVEAPTFEGAVATAWAKEINPGGLVVGKELKDEGAEVLKAGAVDWTNRLLNRYEVMAMEAEVKKGLERA